mgnify:CR=1 FL=1
MENEEKMQKKCRYGDVPASFFRIRRGGLE